MTVKYQIGWVLMAFWLLLVQTGCTSQASPEPAPPTIHYGEDICEFCGMIISEERYAAGYITRDGEARIFDDLAGMFQNQLQKQDDVLAFFVHDYADPHWIRAETALYVLAKDLPTPMLSGLVAAGSADKAEALAAEFNGQVLTFDEVLAHYRQASSAKHSVGQTEHAHR